MQHDVLRSLRELDLRSNFYVYLVKSYYISFDPSRRDKHDGDNIILPSEKTVKVISDERFC